MAAVQVNPWPDVIDRNHGTVPDLCHSLGYPVGPVAGRKGSTLATSTAGYRKSITELDPTRPRCPLDADNAVAIEYARGWIDQNKHFFQYSEAAELHGWPILPDDYDHIVIHVARLMCTQERFWRSNQNYFSKKKPEPSLETSEPHSARKPKPAAAASSIITIANEDERQIVADNTTVHLQFAYPFDGVPVMSTKWLFEPLVMFEKMIVTEAVDPFVVRYLHENNLYHIRDKARVEQFVRDTIRHYVLRRENMEWDYRVHSRCEQMIKEFAKVWKPYVKLGFGFLQDGPGGMHKTAEFEKKWTYRRKLWLDRVHQGASGHIVEWNNNPRLFHVEGASSINSGVKRKPQSVNNSSTSTPNNQRKDKRARVDQPNTSVIKTEPGNSMGRLSISNTIILGDTDDEEDRPNAVYQRSRNPIPPDPYQIALDQYDSYIGRKAEGQRTAIRSSNSRASLPANPSMNSNNGRAIAPSPLVAQPPRRSIGGHMSMSAAHHKEQMSKKSLAELIASEDLSVISTPQPQPPDSNFRRATSSFNGPSNLSTPTGRNPPATLHFAIQDETGVPDDEPSSLLSKKQIYEMSLSDLFTMVAHKSGTVEGHLQQLTFRCQWEPASFVVSKMGGEDAWKRQKKKLYSLFVAALAEFPDDDEFEVWVLCGDRVSKKKSLKVEDGEEL